MIDLNSQNLETDLCSHILSVSNFHLISARLRFTSQLAQSKPPALQLTLQLFHARIFYVYTNKHLGWISEIGHTETILPVAFFKGWDVQEMLKSSEQVGNRQGTEKNNWENQIDSIKNQQKNALDMTFC